MTDTELDPPPVWASLHGLVKLRDPDTTDEAGTGLDRLLAAEVLYRFGFAYDEQIA